MNYSIIVDGKPFIIFRQPLTVYNLLNLTGQNPDECRLVMVVDAMYPPEIPLALHDIITLHNRSEVFKTIKK